MLEQAKNTLRLEAQSILAMAERLDERFLRAVEILFACRGRVVVTGMGKSGLIGAKLAATLASTGTPAFFLHPAEGSHGDIGMVTNRDVVIALSNSGETWEVNALLPVIKRLGVPLIGLVGHIHSTLGRMSEVALDVSVAQEACPLGLAPTCSTTAALAMGDALAVSLLERREFRSDQFALLHPGGSLGKRLLLRVADVMHEKEKIPLVDQAATMHQAILVMTAKRFGMTGVTNGHDRVVGIITDGDLRRGLEGGEALLSKQARELMTPDPKTINPEALAVEAVKSMEESRITSLFVMDQDKLVGLIHLHDLLAAGLM
ncbi:MAG: KpsF/GutQ family sugar-phosphate isomerase [Magnetococcales bacterium]|nr:KpsF/GutQ family sugar-phosphate isomerase [Magnetococcales bacterium]